MAIVQNLKILSGAVLAMGFVGYLTRAPESAGTWSNVTVAVIAIAAFILYWRVNRSLFADWRPAGRIVVLTALIGALMGLTLFVGSLAGLVPYVVYCKSHSCPPWMH